MLKRLFLILISVLLFLSPGLAEPLPGIAVDQPVFDFGEVRRGDEVVHTFTFRNSGDAELLIDRVKSTCGCTGVLLTEKNIPPGAEGTIKATFRSGNFQGRVTKRILLYSNVPGAEPVRFTIQGMVNPLLTVTPDRLDFESVPVGQVKTITAVLTNQSEKPVTLLRLRTTNGAFRAEVASTYLESQATTELKIISQPVTEDMLLNGTVLIRIGGSGVGEVRIPVSGKVAVLN
jgi:hypothetical protein